MVQGFCGTGTWTAGTDPSCMLSTEIPDSGFVEESNPEAGEHGAADAGGADGAGFLTFLYSQGQSIPQ